MNEHNDMVILTLGREDYELKLGHKALKAFSAATGIKMDELGTIATDYAAMSQLVSVMLCTRYPALTAATVDDLLEELSPLEIMGKAGEAIAAAFPAPPEEAAENPTPAAL